VKVDVWHYRTADGRGLRQAIDFLKPYLGNQPQPWPYKQIHAAKVEDLCLPLRRASQVWADSAYEKLQQEISIKGGKNSQLLAPSGLTIEPNR
jgi:hypothetical protein